MKLKYYLTKIFFYEQPTSKKFNLSQFVFSFLIYLGCVSLIMSNAECIGLTKVLGFFWGFALFGYLSYYQSNNITWHRGLATRPLVAPWQIFTFSMLFLVPLAIICE